MQALPTPGTMQIRVEMHSSYLLAYLSAMDRGLAGFPLIEPGNTRGKRRVMPSFLWILQRAHRILYQFRHGGTVTRVRVGTGAQQDQGDPFAELYSRFPYGDLIAFCQDDGKVTILIIEIAQTAIPLIGIAVFGTQ